MCVFVCVRGLERGVMVGGGGGTLAVVRLGRQSWQTALRMQKQAHAAVYNGGRDHVLLVEHPPTFSFGRREEKSPAEKARLLALGADIARAQRGGQTTYHGPGQLVGYPVISLRRR